MSSRGVQECEERERRGGNRGPKISGLRRAIMPTAHQLATATDSAGIECARERESKVCSRVESEDGRRRHLAKSAGPLALVRIRQRCPRVPAFVIDVLCTAPAASPMHRIRTNFTREWQSTPLGRIPRSLATQRSVVNIAGSEAHRRTQAGHRGVGSRGRSGRLRVRPCALIRAAASYPLQPALTLSSRAAGEAGLLLPRAASRVSIYIYRALWLSACTYCRFGGARRADDGPRAVYIKERRVQRAASPWLALIICVPPARRSPHARATVTLGARLFSADQVDTAARVRSPDAGA